jgi:uncharacterized membrane protein
LLSLPVHLNFYPMASNYSNRVTASGSSQVNINKTERMISVVGGSILLASAVRMATRRPGAAIASTLGGIYLLFRGSTGHCHASAAIGRNTANSGSAGSRSLTITETMQINRPKEQVYAFWRKLENLPQFMTHLKTVQELNERESHWEAKIPGGVGKIAWDAEIIQDHPNKMISWRSKPGAMVDNAGEVSFRSINDDRGCEVRAVISYMPPAGDLGQMAAKWLNKTFERIIRKDLQEFKHLMQTTRIPSDGVLHQ